MGTQYRGINALTPAPIVSGPTSTFAWYQATEASISAASGTRDSATLTSNVSVSATTDVETMTVTLTEGAFGTDGVAAAAYHDLSAVASPAHYYEYKSGGGSDLASKKPSEKLQLVHQGTSSLEHYYVSKSGQIYAYGGENTLYDYAIYKVEITFTATTNMSAAQVAGHMAGKTLTVSVTSEGTDSGRINGAFIVDAAALAYNTTTETATGTLSNNVTQVVGYLLIWFDGGDTAADGSDTGFTNDGTTALSGNVQIDFSYTA